MGRATGIDNKRQERKLNDIIVAMLRTYPHRLILTSNQSAVNIKDSKFLFTHVDIYIERGFLPVDSIGGTHSMGYHTCACHVNKADNL